MAAQFPTNVVVLPRPAPTKADRNRAAEAFALSLERAAAGDIAGEEAALRTALGAVPDDPAANINYGNRMYNSGRFQEALAYYNTAVSAASANVLALFNRGNALEELGFFAEAIADWTAAVALEPDCGDAHYNLALALSRDGRRREALRHWTKYLGLDGTSAWASRARQERKRLLKLDHCRLSRGRSRERLRGLLLLGPALPLCGSDLLAGLSGESSFLRVGLIRRGGCRRPASPLRAGQAS